MNKKEILQRLFYIDWVLNFHETMKKPSKKTIETIRRLKKESNQIPLAKLLEEIYKKDGKESLWLPRLATYANLIEVRTGDLCADDFHNNIYPGFKTGRKIVDYLKENSLPQEAKYRVDRLKSIIDKYLIEMPIIVRKKDRLYEVLMGNHRAIALILKGVAKTKVLCVCEESESKDYSELNFTI